MEHFPEYVFGVVVNENTAIRSACGLKGTWVTWETVDTLPSFVGAYALLLRLDATTGIVLPESASGVLRPGWHVYVGSARGPGGVRARLARHFRKDKSQHWHIDRITAIAVGAQACAVPGGNECDIADELLATGTFRMSVSGFGNSDCKRCDSHLLTWIA